MITNEVITVRRRVRRSSGDHNGIESWILETDLLRRPPNECRAQHKIGLGLSLSQIVVVNPDMIGRLNRGDVTPCRGLLSRHRVLGENASLRPLRPAEQAE